MLKLQYSLSAIPDSCLSVSHCLEEKVHIWNFSVTCWCPPFLITYKNKMMPSGKVKRFCSVWSTTGLVQCAANLSFSLLKIGLNVDITWIWSIVCIILKGGLILGYKRLALVGRRPGLCCCDAAVPTCQNWSLPARALMRERSKRRAELFSLSQSVSAARSQRLLMSLYCCWISKLSKSVGEMVLMVSEQEGSTFNLGTQNKGLRSQHTTRKLNITQSTRQDFV